MNVKYIKRDAEMDRIADAFSGYIHRHSNLDLVWSEKIGYVLMLSLIHISEPTRR